MHQIHAWYSTDEWTESGRRNSLGDAFERQVLGVRLS